MRKRIPHTRYDLKIRKSDKVVEIGSGHNPSRRANVIVEKFINDNYHRSGDIKIYPYQVFVNADGEHLLKTKNLTISFVTRFLSMRKILYSL